MIYSYLSSSEPDNQLSATHGEEAAPSSYNPDIADIISYSYFDPDTTSGDQSFVNFALELTFSVVIVMFY